MSGITSEDFKNGMRHLAAAVNVISAMVDGKPRGMLATAVCSVCADPPTLLICINRAAQMHKTIAEGSRFCVSVLDEQQFETATNFMTLDRDARFKLCDWDTLATGAPAIRNALVNFDAEVDSRIDVGTHTIFLGRIVELRLSDRGLPLVYHDGNYAGLKEVTPDLSS